VVPALPLLATSGGNDAIRPLFTRSLLLAVRNSLALGAGVGLISFVVGLPLGVLAALYRFRGQSLFVLLQAVPLLLPSFLLAIGWSNLTAGPGPLGLRALAPAGLAGSVFVLGWQAVPLPLFAAWAACRNLTGSQLDAARLHGGERSVLGLSARACATPALFAALLAGVVTLSDPGAALILGTRVAAVEILTSFSSLFDYNLAARQCLVLAGLVLVIAAPMLWLGLPSLAAAVLARQTRPAMPFPHPWLGTVAACGLTAALLGLLLPTIGLCLPAVNNPMLARAAQTVERTWADTLVYSCGAGLVGTVCATSIAMAVGRLPRVRLAVLGLLIGLFALPPALAGLGTVQLAAQAPAQLDWLTRSSATVGLILGFRFLPVATVALLRGVGAMSPSWFDAARLHGVSPVRFFVRVAFGLLRPALVVAFLLVAVLATADITTLLLVQPPGRESLPVAIFTVMANSPEGFVASLCLLYLACVVTLLAVAAFVCSPGFSRLLDRLKAGLRTKVRWVAGRGA
jgi:ABC-type Fe3+ transport system permease subunit